MIIICEGLWIWCEPWVRVVLSCWWHQEWDLGDEVVVVFDVGVVWRCRAAGE